MPQLIALVWHPLSIRQSQKWVWGPGKCCPYTQISTGQ